MKWAPGIRAVVRVEDLGSTPACVHRANGTIFINNRIFRNLERQFPDHHRDMKFFILLHEWAHVDLKSRDEKAVDAHAFREYLKFPGRSLKAAVWALTHLLNANSREHKERMALQLSRAIEYDKTVNQNPNFS